MFVSQGLSFSNTHLLAQGQAVRSAPIQDLAPFCLSVTPRPSPPQASTQARCSPAGLSGQTPGRAAPRPDLSTATALRIQLRGRGGASPVFFMWQPTPGGDTRLQEPQERGPTWCRPLCCLEMNLLTTHIVTCRGYSWSLVFLDQRLQGFVFG